MGLQHRYIEYNGIVSDHYYLCHYRPLSAGADMLSKSLVQFKAGYSVDVQAWMEVATEALSDLLGEDCVLIRPLSHDELEWQGANKTKRGLDILGERIAMVTSCKYCPDILRKTSMIPPLKTLKRRERFEVLTNCYQLNGTLPEGSKVFLIDDILTTGATMQTIIQLLSEVAPSVRISIFTLAFSCAETVNETTSLKSLHYAWDVSGRWVAAEMEAGYLSFNYLRKLILEDGF